MSPNIILLGSLAGAALFVCGFFLGSLLTNRLHEKAEPRIETRIDPNFKLPGLPERSVDQIAASLKAAEPKPAPRPQSSKFLMQPDRRPKVDRENDQAMGELIDEVAQRGDAEL